MFKKSLVTGHSRMFTVATESTGMSSFMLPVLLSSWQMQQNTLGHHFFFFIKLGMVIRQIAKYKLFFTVFVLIKRVFQS